MTELEHSRAIRNNKNLNSDTDITAMTLFLDSEKSAVIDTHTYDHKHSNSSSKHGQSRGFPIEYDMGIALSRTLSNDNSETGEFEDRPHKFLRRQCEFTEETPKFLNRYTRQFPESLNTDGSKSYYIPLHGMTDRAVVGNDSKDVKYFRSLMKLTVPADAHNLDQCLFQRSYRIEETKEEFQKELANELRGNESLRPNTGPLNFFTHGCFSGAGVTDTDAIRLAMLTGSPTVTVDWQSTQGPWYTLPFRYAVDYYSSIAQEKSFEKPLDESIAFVDPSRVNLVSFSRGAAFNAAYMHHRFKDRDHLPPVYGHVMAHADLATNTFDSRINGENPVMGASKKTIVLGNHSDKVLFFSRWRIFGDRVGDATKSDISAVTGAGGSYVIDDVQKRGGNLNHYVNYNLIAKLLHNMSAIPKGNAIMGDTALYDPKTNKSVQDASFIIDLTEQRSTLPVLTRKAIR